MKSLVLLSTMLFLDAVWIIGFMGSLYEAQLGRFLNLSQGNRLVLGLIGAYGLMALGMFLFVLKPGVSAVEATLFGTILFGVFAFTNYVIFANWPIVLVIADMLWGSFLFFAMWHIAKWIGYLN